MLTLSWIAGAAADDDDDPPPRREAPAGTSAAAPVAAAGFALPDLVARDQVGARIGLGYAEVPMADADARQGFTVFTVEPFVRVAVRPSLVLYASVPVTWTAGDELRQGGDLANVTGGLLYAAGGLGAGAELSANVGHPPPAHAVLNRFDLDHFADDTYALRLHADIERRAGALRLTGQVAVMVLADEAELGALVRLGGGFGLGLPRGWTAIAEYLVLTDALEDRLGGDDDFQHAVNLGARHAFARGRGTVGLYVHVPLDRSAEDTIGSGLELAGAF